MVQGGFKVGIMNEVLGLGLCCRDVLKGVFRGFLMYYCDCPGFARMTRTNRSVRSLLNLKEKER